MHENHLFEYAVIRIVPRVEREEFLNAGVVLYCPGRQFLKALFEINPKKLKVICDQPCVDEVQENLLAFERICKGDTGSGPIGKLDIAARFRWLTATRSTVVQSSKVHPGFSINPEETLVRLYNQLVL